ncbi:hypothetical protein LguiA_017406 [Lonicera macranthoides]
MAFLVSENQQSFSEKVTEIEPTTKSSVTTFLYLKPTPTAGANQPSSGTGSGTLNKDAVRRRIRHHKYMKKVQNTFHDLLTPYSDSSAEQKWLELGDVFSAP